MGLFKKLFAKKGRCKTDENVRNIEPDELIKISPVHSGDKVACKILNRQVILTVESVYKNAGENLSDEEIEEINWLISSNVLESKEMQNKLIKQINFIYKQWEDNYRPRKRIDGEIDVTTIMVDINTDDSGDTGEVTKIVAFCGEAKCDEEHGISISFKSRKFMSIGAFMDFNYDPQPAFDYSKWKEENPLMGMVPKFANVLIRKNYTDERKICFFKQIYYGEYNAQIEKELEEWVLPSGSKNVFEHYAVSVKGDNLLIINHPHNTNLTDCLKNCVTISRAEIIKTFILKKDYVVNSNLTNHFMNIHFVLKENRILIMSFYEGDKIAEFLINNFCFIK